LTEDVQYNRGCSLKMTLTLMDPQDLELASKAEEIML
jgi:hypothetical protein